jgi:NADPH2:quinone reductase
MRAIVVDRFGGPDELRRAELPVPEPGPGQVRVRVAYAGVNPADWKDREGLVAGFFEVSFPHTLGFDAAGTVDATGAGVTAFAPGDRVFTTSDHGEGAAGSWAEYLLVSEPRLAKVPPALGLAEAAAAPVAALTARQALLDPAKGNLQQGQKVLIHGASGGVGSYAVQIATHAGARVATTCSTANLDYVRVLGAALATDYRDQCFQQRIATWAPEGLDLVLDAVGGDSLPRRLELLREGGRLVSIATLVADGDVAAETERARAVGREKIYAIMDTTHAGVELEQVAALLAGGQIKSPPLRLYDLEDARDALEEVRGGHVRGKVLLRVCGD